MRSLIKLNEVPIVFLFTVAILFLLSVHFGFSLSNDAKFIEEEDFYKSNISNLIIENTKSDNNNVSRKQAHLPSKVVKQEFVTKDKKTLLSGIRIEALKTGEPDFIGYTDKGLSIVAPNTEVRVVLFGAFLDDVVLVGFTLSQNCSETVLNIVQEDFSIQTDRRIVIIYEFAESKSIYKICLKQKPADGVLIDLPFYLVDDLRCSVSTDMPPRKYYFPMYIQISIVAAFLVLSGLFSGLNLGLMSLTPQELTLISNSGSSKERKYAQMILPVRKSGNQLLCSLLIGNVCVNSAISILFDDLTSGYVALAISSAGIVVFGEIFPQALCVKKGLAVGAHTIWVTRFFMVLTFPLAYPISKVLDRFFGDEVVSYDRKRLMELIKLSTKNAIGPAEELKIAIGAFEMGDKTVKDVMTKIDDVFMIPINTVLNAKIVAQIVHSGYTRIPVYDKTRDNVISLLFVKDLAMLDPDDNFLVKTVCDYYRHPVRRVPENTPLRTMLEEFKKGEYHMALVDRLATGDKESKYELVGLVTLEDIVEEILQAEIVDETDMVTDNVHKTKLKKNNLHFMHLFNDEGSACQISLQMQVVTIQFLEGNFKAFSRDRIAQPILERVIRNHVHKVEVSHLTDFNDALTTALPRKAKLYTKKQLSDNFILILEGRAVITIGQNSMNFEVGPWQYFGTEILNQFDDLIHSLNPQRQSIDSSSNSTNNMLGPNKAMPTNPSEIDKIDSVVNRPSLPGILSVISTGSQQQFVDSTAQDVAKRIKFLPDFSLVIRSECTYLEISSQTYLAMYRATLMTRNKVDASGANIAIDGVQPDVVSATEQNPSIANFYVPVSPQQQTGNMKEINDLVDNKPKERKKENGVRKLSFEMDESSDHNLEKNSAAGNSTQGIICKRMNESNRRHRRTNSDATVGLLSNGLDDANGEIDETLVEDDKLGRQKLVA